MTTWAASTRSCSPAGPPAGWAATTNRCSRWRAARCSSTSWTRSAAPAGASSSGRAAISGSRSSGVARNRRGGGPVAAIGAALPHVDADTVLVLAADLPWIAPAIDALQGALDDPAVDVAMLTSDGQANYLAAAWRTRALSDAIGRLAWQRRQPASRCVPSSRESPRASSTWSTTRRTGATTTTPWPIWPEREPKGLNDDDPARDLGGRPLGRSRRRSRLDRRRAHCST